MKITQITAHLGAGAGKAIVGLCCMLKEQYPDVEIIILVAEKPEKMQAIKKAVENEIVIKIQPSDNEMIDICNKSDLIVINWWAHPLMYAVLNKLNGIEGRFILWNHFNGCVYPKLDAELCKAFSHVLFTCQYSYENDQWNEQQREWIQKHSDIVYGLGDFLPSHWRYRQEYENTNVCKVGYLGTIDYNKINNGWLKACEEIHTLRPNTKFVLYGDLSKQIKSEIVNSKIASYIEYCGYAENVEEAYLEMDILGYPLNAITSGTTENVLLEAMATGLPCVVLNQATERNIIKNNKTGICADDMAQYVEKIVELIDKKEERKIIGEGGRADVIQNYDGRKNAYHFFEIAKELKKKPKERFEIKKMIGDRPSSYFLNCFPKKIKEEWKDEVIKMVLDGKSKSSLKQFQRVFSNDEELSKLELSLRGI